MGGLSEYDRKHMADILAGQGDWFSAQLLRLIAKADHENLKRLRQVYPEHVEAYEAWHSGPRPLLRRA